MHLEMDLCHLMDLRQSFLDFHFLLLDAHLQQLSLRAWLFQPFDGPPFGLHLGRSHSGFRVAPRLIGFPPGARGRSRNELAG